MPEEVDFHQKTSTETSLEKVDSRQNVLSQESESSTSTNRWDIMISYDWSVQGSVLRLVGALKALGYKVWVDVEQMKGSSISSAST